MFKWIVHIKKKEGLSREDPIDYYENKHEPLILSLLPKLAVYRRNYLVDDPIIGVDGRSGNIHNVGYDVLTECVFKNREDAEEFVAVLSRPEVIGRIKEDEANFVEPQHDNVFVVEVRESRIAGQAPANNDVP
jgi:hypothetical protein